MSVVYKSYAVIGIEIDLNKCFKMGTERNCKCVVAGIENMKFCPTCGLKAHHMVQNPISEYDDDVRTEHGGGPFEKTLCGYPILFNSYDEEEGCGGKGVALVALYWASDNKQHNSVMAKLSLNLEEIKEEMKNKLDPLGMWDEKKFGLWSLLYCSH